MRLFIVALWSPAGKGLTSWLSLWCPIVKLLLSHWYPGSGVVLDCINFWSLICPLSYYDYNGKKTFKIFSETMRPTPFILSMLQCAVVPYINYKILPIKPLVSKLIKTFHRLIIGKTLGIFSETMRPTAYIFSMLQCLVVLYINPANHTPGVQIGHTLDGL